MIFEKAKDLLLVAEFSDSEFKQLRAICDIRLGGDREKSLEVLDESLDSYTQAFYGQLRRYLTLRRIPSVPLSILKRTKPKAFANVKSCASFLYSVAEDWNTSATMRRPYVSGVYHLYTKLVVDYLENIKVPVSALTVVQHAEKFVGLVDIAYPGYVSGGMINMVVLGPGKTANTR